MLKNTEHCAKCGREFGINEERWCLQVQHKPFHRWETVGHVCDECEKTGINLRVKLWKNK